jgi:glyoxylate reductase
MKSIFITRAIPQKAIDTLKAKGYDVDINPKDSPLSPKQLKSYLTKKPYDAVLSLLTDRIDATIYDAAPTVRLYANYASGFDNIDIVEAHKRGITITNAPALSSAVAVAEHAIALMFALATRLLEADPFVRKGKYHGWAPMNFIGTSMAGKTVGLIGAGKIGEMVAHYAKGMDFSVIYSDVVRNKTIEEKYGATYYSLEEVLQKADFVSIHAPLLESTRHIIDEAHLAMMKPTSFLINTSRGPLVDEKALVKALKNKVIAGAGLDVFEYEPKTAPGLTKLSNVILTPHIASASIEARQEMADIAVKNIIDFFEDRVPQYTIHG